MFGDPSMGNNKSTLGTAPRNLTSLYQDIEQEEKHYLTAPDAGSPGRLPHELAQRLFGGQVRGRKKHSNQGRQAGRICRQVRDAIMDFLATETDHEILNQLQVESVTPAPNSKRLRVILSFPTWLWDQPVNLSQMRADLTRMRPDMRAEVAAVINRRHVPELIIELLQPGEVRQS